MEAGGWKNYLIKFKVGNRTYFRTELNSFGIGDAYRKKIVEK